ncbi:MAG: Na+/H+ antiporter NhaC family protein, partial [Firmicutes bacterium]|nr:Na+/H+ antiporter NhaC family protein [Candidatus Caballimonas caccae]
VAILLALITKEVYVSLFFGIFVGAMFYAEGNPINALGDLFEVMSDKVGANVPIIVFLVILGIFVVLMQKSGGSKAYGDWATKRIKSKKGALTATAGLGCLIFVDDYFNCLTVGSVMRPVTDKFKVSHSKLAWIIDSTAAPVCIIAPISSWAAAVGSNLEGSDSIATFIKTIPFNIYALLTIALVFVLCLTKLDFGLMKKHEKIADDTGNLDAGSEANNFDDLENVVPNSNGKVSYLIVPVVTLIVCCVLSMIYVGYFYNWDTEHFTTVAQSSSVIEAFSNCDAGYSLAIGSIVALIIVSVYYIATKAISFKDITDSFTKGFKTMVPSILILTFAWTISGIMGAKGGYLDAQGFIDTTIREIPQSLQALFPVIFFALACGIAFATGTSWGTFGVLVPIITMPSLLGGSSTIAVLSVAATLGGAVFGDHVSPISDTTIMSSTGANCNHIDHVKTQFPYAGLVAIVCAVTYLIAGFITIAIESYALSALLTIVIG